MKCKWLILLLTLCCVFFIVTACGAPSDSSTSSGSEQSTDSSSYDAGSSSETDSSDPGAPPSDSSVATPKIALIQYRLSVEPIEGGENLVWGEMDDQLVEDGDSLNAFAFTLTNKYEVEFKGWTTTKGGTTVEYEDGATYHVAESGEIITLYAVIEVVWFG